VRLFVGDPVELPLRGGTVRRTTPRVSAGRQREGQKGSAKMRWCGNDERRTF